MLRLNISEVRNTLLLCVFWLYMLFNYGFMQVRGPLGIPVGEFILLFSLCTINYRALLPKFLPYIYSIPLSAWWLFGLVSILWNLPQYGFWSIRDASNIVESLFIVIGFAFAGSKVSLDRFRRWFPVMLFSGLLYGLTYPFREFLINLSPMLEGAQGQGVPLLFNYVNTPLVLLILSAYCYQRAKLGSPVLYSVLCVFTLLVVLLFFPSRTLFFELAILGFILLPKLKVQELPRYLSILGGGVLFLVIIFSAGITINGRFGTGFEFSDYITLFTEIFQFGEHDHSLSSGNAIRILWWTDILKQWMQSWWTVIFGIGYGMPLLDFVGGLGSQVREPHNDVISITARGGLIAILAFIGFQLATLARCSKLHKYLSGSSPYAGIAVSLFCFMLFVLVNMIGESPFIMSFYAIPYYFSAGILLRMYVMRREL